MYLKSFVTGKAFVQSDIEVIVIVSLELFGAFERFYWHTKCNAEGTFVPQIFLVRSTSMHNGYENIYFSWSYKKKQ